MNTRKTRARDLRASQTKSEGLVWSVLRSKQVCGLKFRRQHPIGPYFADFACVTKKLVVEIDGSSHDLTAAADLARESFIRKQGWEILRFSNDDVESDAEMLARGISKHLGLPYEFEERQGTGAGMFAQQPSPQARERACDPPKGRVK